MSFVRMHNPQTGAYAEVPADAVAHHERLGWTPEGEPRSYTEAVAEQAARDDEAALAAQEVALAAETETVADVLTRVGDDPDLARAALDAEQASDKPRKTLVDRLTTIAADSGQNGE